MNKVNQAFDLYICVNSMAMSVLIINLIVLIRYPPYHQIFGTTGLRAHHRRRKIEPMNDREATPSLADLDIIPRVIVQCY